MKKMYIIIEIIVLAIVGIYFIASKSSHNQIVSQPSNNPVQKNTAFDFLGNHYVLGSHASENVTQEVYKYIPQGQTIDNWQNLITIVQGKTKIGEASLSDIDKTSESAIKEMKNKGAAFYNLVYDPEHAGSGSLYYIDSVSGVTNRVMVFIFPEPNNTFTEVDIKKIFIDDSKSIVTNTYSTKVYGDAKQSIDEKNNSILKQIQSQNLGKQFVSYKFPEPWVVKTDSSLPDPAVLRPLLEKTLNGLQEAIKSKDANKAMTLMYFNPPLSKQDKQNLFSKESLIWSPSFLGQKANRFLDIVAVAENRAYYLILTTTSDDKYNHIADIEFYKDGSVWKVETLSDNAGTFDKTANAAENEQLIQAEVKKIEGKFKSDPAYQK